MWRKSAVEQRIDITLGHWDLEHNMKKKKDLWTEQSVLSCERQICRWCLTCSDTVMFWISESVLVWLWKKTMNDIKISQNVIIYGEITHTKPYSKNKCQKLTFHETHRNINPHLSVLCKKFILFYASHETCMHQSRWQ